MFCNYCGNKIEDGAGFCPFCGKATAQATKQVEEPTTTTTQEQAVAKETQPIAQEKPVAQTQPVTQTAAPAGENVGTKFSNLLKLFFSSKMQSGLTISAQSKTYEGLIYAAIFAVSIGLSMPVVCENIVKKNENLEFIEDLLEVEIFSVSKFFFPGFLAGALISLILALAYFVLGRTLKINNISFMQAWNMTQYATIPVTIALIGNMLLSLIWPPLAFVAIAGSIILQMLMIYIGMQEFEKLQKSQLISFSVTALIATVGIVITLYCVYKEAIENIVDNIF